MELICLQIDLARQKENVEYVKSYIDFAKNNGYNSVLFYLENAVRTEDTEYFDKEDTYSANEIKTLVDYGESRGIDIIPAFETLGHLEKFFEYKQLENFSECEDEQKEGRGFYSLKRGTCGCPNSQGFYEFFDKYVSDVSALFKSPYIHAGLDEPFDFAVCKRCGAELKKGKSKSDLFYENVMHDYNLIKKLGKTMLMWDDFFEFADIADKLPRDIVFCNWNYYFVSDEPAGHWTNRVKRDWIYYYNKLGFRSVFCTYANDYSSAYNAETFTDYASSRKPFGAMMTSWDKDSGFYLGTYPLAAYYGRLWSGKCKAEDKLAVYTEITGSKRFAEIILGLSVPAFYSGYSDVINVSENEYLVKRMYRETFLTALNRLKAIVDIGENGGDLKADIRTNIYLNLLEFYSTFIIEQLGEDLFDIYEGKTEKTEKVREKVGKLKENYDIIEKRFNYLYKKYRVGIKPKKDFYEKFTSRRAYLAEIEKIPAKNERCGVLYVDLMQYDGFGTPNCEIAVKYAGEEEKILYTGGIKSSLTGFEAGGCYTLKFRADNKPIEYIIFTAKGESATYPQNFRFVAGGIKYVAKGVSSISGKTENIENLLFNDTRFATLGYDDGKAHFENVDLGKERNSVKITFGEL